MGMWPEGTDQRVTTYPPACTVLMLGCCLSVYAILAFVGAVKNLRSGWAVMSVLYSKLLRNWFEAMLIADSPIMPIAIPTIVNTVRSFLWVMSLKTFFVSALTGSPRLSH